MTERSFDRPDTKDAGREAPMSRVFLPPFLRGGSPSAAFRPLLLSLLARPSGLRPLEATTLLPLVPRLRVVSLSLHLFHPLSFFFDSRVATVLQNPDQATPIAKEKARCQDLGLTLGLHIRWDESTYFPPAMAGTMDTRSPGFSGVAVP